MNYPLPKVWRDELLKNNFRTNVLTARFSWTLFLFKVTLLYGLFNNFKERLLISSIIRLFYNSMSDTEGGVFIFDRLTIKNNLPSENMKKGIAQHSRVVSQ